MYSFPLQLSKVSEFSFVISSVELRHNAGACAVCVRSVLLPSSISSHNVWSTTPASDQLTRVEDQEPTYNVGVRSLSCD